eukprot:COSAG04_NODE_943_length_9239_cov_3.297155_4_plen_186_part_00
MTPGGWGRVGSVLGRSMRWQGQISRLGSEQPTLSLCCARARAPATPGAQLLGLLWHSAAARGAPAAPPSQPYYIWPSVCGRQSIDRARDYQRKSSLLLPNKIGVHYALQKLVKSACAQCACIIACWCWPVQMKQFPFEDFFAPVSPHRASLSQIADGEHDAGAAGGGSHDRRRAAAPPGTRRRWQ